MEAGEKVKSVFDGHSAKYDAWYARNAYAYLSELIALEAALPEKGKKIEIGVGTGRFALPLKVKYGIDPSKNMLKIAAARGVRVKQSFGEDIPYKERSFDAALIMVALSFVRDPEKVVLEAARILRRGGVLVVGMIDGDSFLGNHYRRKKGSFYINANLLSVEKVSGLMRKAGFRRLSYTQTIFRLPGDMRSVHKVTKGHGKGGFVVIRGKLTKSRLNLSPVHPNPA
ncbi:MAG: class I SAM-dependent methyltransferase [Candidatus Omnitrophica bacterium]|nr:class I SAM-dependent methyltransferase [Candidatus Omnitrophota bacterium]